MYVGYVCAYVHLTKFLEHVKYTYLLVLLVSTSDGNYRCGDFFEVHLLSKLNCSYIHMYVGNGANEIDLFHCNVRVFRSLFESFVMFSKYDFFLLLESFIFTLNSCL